jgi:hypothetical protein
MHSTGVYFKSLENDSCQANPARGGIASSTSKALTCFCLCPLETGGQIEAFCLKKQSLPARKYVI